MRQVRLAISQAALTCGCRSGACSGTASTAGGLGSAPPSSEMRSALTKIVLPYANDAAPSLLATLVTSGRGTAKYLRARVHWAMTRILWLIIFLKLFKRPFNQCYWLSVKPPTLREALRTFQQLISTT